MSFQWSTRKVQLGFSEASQQLVNLENTVPNENISFSISQVECL